jgi:hypothetical protein
LGLTLDESQHITPKLAALQWASLSDMANAKYPSGYAVTMSEALFEIVSLL